VLASLPTLTACRPNPLPGRYTDRARILFAPYADLLGLLKQEAAESEVPLPSPGKTRIAVVSPFLDRQHGTERCVVEQVERLARHYEVHVYSNRVQDLDLSQITWHAVPALPGPHLFSFCWWIIANHVWRWWDRHFGGLSYDLTFTPGTNCFNADIVSVHIVFAEFYRSVRNELKFRANPVRTWPLLAHRRIYYRLIMGMESLIYRGSRAVLTAVSGKVARDLAYYGRDPSKCPVILHGVDARRFNVALRQHLRAAARRSLGVPDQALCLLLVGNDWKKKGLPCVLEALAQLETAAVHLLVVGQDMLDPYRSALSRLHLRDRVTFLPLRPDVEFYYAAADLYVGPSLEDAFGLPPLEAMACGLPSIVSRETGVSELITDGEDGFILKDPHDSRKLAQLISLLYNNKSIYNKMGAAAGETAARYTWDRNATQLMALFQAQRGGATAQLPSTVELPRN